MRELPEARFLNLEYIFNKFFESFGLLWQKIIALFFLLRGMIWVSIFISIVFSLGIIFVLFKITYLHRKRIFHLVDLVVREEVPEIRKNKWDEIQKKIDSENISDWKMAIIEADSLIDEIVKSIGYKGEDLGERLKSIEPSDFDNLQNVWEAHKVRNRIVHEGDKFIITKEEVKEVIEKYSKALKELKYI